MQVYSHTSEMDCLSQIIETLHERGLSEPIRVADRLGSNYLLTCAGEFAVTRVRRSFKHADIEGGMMPGPYWTATLEQQDWRPGTPTSLRDRRYTAELLCD